MEGGNLGELRGHRPGGPHNIPDRLGQAGGIRSMSAESYLREIARQALLEAGLRDAGSVTFIYSRENGFEVVDRGSLRGRITDEALTNVINQLNRESRRPSQENVQLAGRLPEGEKITVGVTEEQIAAFKDRGLTTEGYAIRGHLDTITIGGHEIGVPDGVATPRGDGIPSPASVSPPSNPKPPSVLSRIIDALKFWKWF